MFTGFTDATVDFLWGIRFNNERPWFEAHKETYLSELYRPMKDLGAEIYEFLSERRPEDAYRLLVSGGVQFVFQLLGSLQLSLFLLTLFDPLVRPRRHCAFPR